ncbi:Pre-mRNA-splicing factor SPF27 [Circinella umbellata]|nr:Pre-mRNA-splicing factor SPF27 [Circinella umbellata]
MSTTALLTESSSTSATRNDSDIDALPYVDREIDDPATVERLIDQELRRMRRKPGSDRSQLPMEVELFQNNDILKQEWDRVKKKEPLNALDYSRYEIKAPEEDEADETEWKKAVDNSKAQLESQTDSMFNLELLAKFGPNAWRVHNYQLEGELKQLQQTTSEYRDAVLRINRERKADQTQAGGSLRTLENKWSDLISQNLQVDIASSALEQEVEELRRYRASLKAKAEQN